MSLRRLLAALERWHNRTAFCRHGLHDRERTGTESEAIPGGLRVTRRFRCRDCGALSVDHFEVGQC